MQETTVVPYFITGIGTDVGKTVSSAIVASALNAWYWKPVQAGLEPGTDQQTVAALADIPAEKILPESYCLLKPASPHWAAREENIQIDIKKIAQDFNQILEHISKNSSGKQYLLIEGAGGIMVPLSETQFVADMIKQLNIPSILVSRHYLGSINHSMLSAEYCRMKDIEVKGWIFNGSYGHYAEEICNWTGLPQLAAFPELPAINPETIAAQATEWADTLKRTL